MKDFGIICEVRGTTYGKLPAAVRVFGGTGYSFCRLLNLNREGNPPTLKKSVFDTIICGSGLPPPPLRTEPRAIRPKRSNICYKTVFSIIFA